MASSEDEGSKGGTRSTQGSKYSGGLGVKNERIKGKIRKGDSPGLGKMRGVNPGQRGLINLGVEFRARGLLLSEWVCLRLALCLVRGRR